MDLAVTASVRSILLRASGWLSVVACWGMIRGVAVVVVGAVVFVVVLAVAMGSSSGCCGNDDDEIVVVEDDGSCPWA